METKLTISPFFTQNWNILEARLLRSWLGTPNNCGAWTMIKGGHCSNICEYELWRCRRTRDGAHLACTHWSSESTEKFFDFWPSWTSLKPLEASPRLSSSRIAADLLGIRFAKRYLSIARSSSCMSMICSLSLLLGSPIAPFLFLDSLLRRQRKLIVSTFQ
jgi:hypothetical protein